MVEEWRSQMRWWQQLPYSCPTSVALVLTTPFSPLSSQRINQTQTLTLSPHLPTRASLPAWTHSSSIPALSPLHLAAEAEMFPSKKIWFFLFVTWFRCSMPTTTSLDCLGNLSLSPYHLIVRKYLQTLFHYFFSLCLFPYNMLENGGFVNFSFMFYFQLIFKLISLFFVYSILEVGRIYENNVM